MVQVTRSFWLVFAALFAMSTLTISCSDDDDDNGDDNGGNGSPSVEEGEANMTISGSANTSLEGSGVTFTDTTRTVQGNDIAQVDVSYEDTTGNIMSASFVAQNSVEPGTYVGSNNQGQGDGSLTVSFFVEGGSYTSIESGDAEITTRTEETVVGTFNDLKLGAAQGDSTITVSGEFNAQPE